MDQLLFRMADEADAPALLEIYAHYVRHSAVSFELEAPGLDEFRRRINAVLSFHPYIVCERDGRCLGYAYSSTHMERAAYQWNASLSVYLRKEQTGQGLGSALYQRLIALSQLQNLCNLYGGVARPNPASERLHEKLGFTRLGVYRRTGFKFGRWHDVVWFEKRLCDPSGAPAPPLSWRQIDPGLVRTVLRKGSPA